MADELPQLTPLQNRTLGVIRRSPDPVVFAQDFIASLRDDMAEAITDLTERVPDGEQIYVSKARLTSVLGCETMHLTPDDFAWSVPTAVGQIAHKAIELSVNWHGDPTPHNLVDEAIDRLAETTRSIGEYLTTFTPGDRAELTGMATDKVTKFLECFPPLDRRARPTTESTTRWPNDGKIVLSGKADLTIGKPAGAESRKVIIDLKTGRVQPTHRDDLRFYALLETMRTHVPPRKLVSFYLDSGTPIVEDVTENVLNSAAKRILDAIDTDIALRFEDRQPTRRPGPPCRWCVVSPGCDEGQNYLNDNDNDNDNTDV